MTTFFFDNDISWRVVEALKQLVDPSEAQLIALRDRFPVSAKDTDWIPFVGQEGWVLISRDLNQRRRDAERQALQAHGVRALYIKQSGNPGDLYQDAARIIRHWPKIEEWGKGAAPGALAKLDSRDTVVPL